MQEAFLTLWERWDTIDRIDDPTGYLFRVALNGSRMRARAARRAARRLVAIAASRTTRSTRSTCGRTSGGCSAHSPRQRAALVLTELRLRLGGGGRIMRIRPSTVRALATQGRAVLRES